MTAKTEGALLTRETLIALMRQTISGGIKPVTVQGWGELYIRSLSVEEVQAEIDEGEEEKKAEGEGKVNGTIAYTKKQKLARNAARLICDASGKRLFDPNSEEDIRLLAAQPWAMLHQVINASDEAKEAQKKGN